MKVDGKVEKKEPTRCYKKEYANLKKTDTKIFFI